MEGPSSAIIYLATTAKQSDFELDEVTYKEVREMAKSYLFSFKATGEITHALENIESRISHILGVHMETLEELSRIHTLYEQF